MIVNLGIIDWLEGNMLPCLFKSNLGVECPGCGMQRAIVALLKGDILGSLTHHPGLIAVIILLVFLVVHIVKPFRYSFKILLILITLTVLTFIINYTLKFI